MANAYESIKLFDLVLDVQMSSLSSKYVRSSINSRDEALKFIKYFSYSTDTAWKIKEEAVAISTYNVYVDCMCENRNCSAEILIYMKRNNHPDTKTDPYLLHKPPLPCVIEINCDHHHDVDANIEGLKAISDEVKEQCYAHFGEGLTVLETRNRLIYSIKKKKGSDYTSLKKTIPSFTKVKELHTLWYSRYKSRYELKDDIMTSLINEYLDEIPKKNLFLQCIPTLPLHQPHLKLLKVPENDGYPLLFQLIERTSETSIEDSEHLFYTLVRGKNQNVTTTKSLPRIFSIVINLPSEGVSKKHISESSSDSENSKSATDTEDEDFENLDEMNTPSSVNSSSIMPVIFKIYKDGVSSAENSPSENVCTFTLNDFLLPDCTITNDIELPLVFTAVDSSEMMYELRQGSDRKVMTNATSPRVLSVEIKSPNHASINNMEFADSTQGICPSLSPKDNPNIHIKEEPLSDDEICDEPNMLKLPIILDTTSCVDTTSLMETNVDARTENSTLASNVETNTEEPLAAEICEPNMLKLPIILDTTSCVDTSSFMETNVDERTENSTLPSNVETNTILCKTEIAETDFNEELTEDVLCETDAVLERVSINKRQQETTGIAPTKKKQKIYYDKEKNISMISTRSRTRRIKVSSNDKTVCEKTLLTPKLEVETYANEKIFDSSHDSLNGVLSGSRASRVSLINEPETQCAKDEDFMFLMSLLPELKKIPEVKKKGLKSTIRNLVMNCNGAFVRKNFIIKSTNIYRECGVLPTFRDMKF